MNKEEALEIISMISDGLDPYGEKEPSIDLPENNPVTMRAVCMAITSLLFKKDRDDFVSKYSTKKLSELAESVNGPLQVYLREKEKELIFKVLLDSNFNKSEAGTNLGLTENEFAQRINILGISQEISVRELWANTESDYIRQLDLISLDEFLDIVEKNALKKALERSNFKKSSAAEILGITFRSFRYRLEKKKINTNVFEYKFDERIKTDFFEHFENLSLDVFLKTINKKMIELALKDTKNSKMRAAEKLGISFRSLRYRVDNLGIQG
jgi:transcriptional regulator with PAS, ATPase and Fis domain